MQTCAKLRMLDNILDACKLMDEHGFGLSGISYNTILHVIQKSDKPFLVWDVYEHMIKKRMHPNEVTFAIMVSALRKEGKLVRYLNVVERIHGKRCSSPGVVVNTCLVFQIIEEGRIEDGLEGRIKEAIHLMQEMESMELKPFEETFNHLIGGCSQVGDWEESLELCKRMINIGLLPSLLAFNKMVEIISKKRDVKLADELLTVLLDKGFTPDENTYSLLAASYGRAGYVEGILKHYHEMKYRSHSPSASIFCTLISSLCQHGRVREAEEYLLLMKAESLEPHAYVYEALVASHLEKG
ncbi:hypothetical protein M9H77_19140 [Catharanthus roseus]|uniref:Uncharacterized protein n=1 Tax=Catharanthus roseus TaxID=4058 RepID=A0ACC0B9G1_CATRO|nr:hypothetical protein M9H77_19140 [Catharanthus roseus]